MPVMRYPPGLAWSGSSYPWKEAGTPEGDPYAGSPSLQLEEIRYGVMSAQIAEAVTVAAPDTV